MNNCCHHMTFFFKTVQIFSFVVCSKIVQYMFCPCSYRLLRQIHLVPSCSTAQSLRPRVLWHSLLSILQRTKVMLDLMFNNNYTNFYCDKKTFMCSSPPTQSLGSAVENASGNMSESSVLHNLTSCPRHC